MPMSDDDLRALLKGIPLIRRVRHEMVQVAEPERRPWFRFFVPRPAWALVALVLLIPAALLFRSKSSGVLPATGSSDEFTARGTDAPSFRISCLDARGTAGACARGSQMVIRVSPGRFNWFAAFIEMPSGQTVWFGLSATGTASVSLAGLDPSGLLPNSIVLDDGYAPGEYAVQAVFSASALTRDQVRQTVTAPSPDKVAVFRQTLVVEAP